MLLNSCDSLLCTENLYFDTASYLFDILISGSEPLVY
jgi:hypothetical protein